MEVTGDLAGNNIADKTTNVSKSSPKNSSEAIEIETENTRFDRDIPPERYRPPEKKQKIINDLRLIL